MTVDTLPIADRAEDLTSQRRNRRAAVAITCVLALLYLLPNYGYTWDGVMYAADVSVRGWGERLNPAHLGYAAAHWLLWAPLHAIGVPLSPLLLLGLTSRIAALGCCWVLATIYREAGWPSRWQLAGVLLFGLAFTTWAYGTTPAVYLPTLLCLLLLYRLLQRWSETPPEPSQLRHAAGWLIAATLLHQLAILTLFPAAVWALVTTTGRWTARLMNAVKLIAWTAIPLALCYVAAYALLFGPQALRNPERFFHWTTRAGQIRTHWWWTELPPGANPWPVLRATVVESHARLLWAMPFGEHMPHRTSDRLATRIQRELRPTLFEVAQELLPPLFLVVLLTGFVLMWRDGPIPRRNAILAVLWTMPLFLFTLAFEPQNSFYRLYYFPQLILFGCAPFVGRRLEGMGWGLLGPFVLLTMAANYAYGWAPRTHRMVNRRLLAAEQHDRRLPPHPLAFVTGEQYGEWQDFEYCQLLHEEPVYRIQFVTLEEAEQRGFSEGSAPGDILVSDVLFQQMRNNWPRDNHYVRLYGAQRWPRVSANALIDVRKVEHVAMLEHGGMTFHHFKVHASTADVPNRPWPSE